MELLFIAYAPTRSGTYDFKWQLFQLGVGFFGEMSANLTSCWRLAARHEFNLHH